MIGKLRIALGVLLHRRRGVVGTGRLEPGRGSARRRPTAPARSPGPPRRRRAGLAMELESCAPAVAAKMAAGIEPLRAALSSRVDVATLVDLFATEDWWRPFRDEVIASRLVVGDAVAHHGPVDLGTFDQSVVAGARRNQQAGEVVAVGGRPLVFAAARVDLNIKGDPVVVLAMPLELKMLEAVAARTKLSLVLDRRQVAPADGRDPRITASSWRASCGGPTPPPSSTARAAGRRPASPCRRP